MANPTLKQEWEALLAMIAAARPQTNHEEAHAFLDAVEAQARAQCVAGETPVAHASHDEGSKT